MLTQSQSSFIQYAEGLWTNAGGNPAIAPQMAAIAAAESGYGTNLVNQKDPGGSYGYWQINGNSWGPLIQSLGGVGVVTSNPNANAQAAVAVYNAQGVNAWSTWKNGSAQAILSQISGSSSGATASSPGLGGAGDPNNAWPTYTPTGNVIVDLFNGYGRWVTDTKINVFYKTLVVVAILIVLAAIPKISKFVFYIALALLFLLLVQKHQ